MKKIYLSGDHAGFDLKNKLKKYFSDKGFAVLDFGPMKYDSKDDYPDFVIAMARAMVKNSKVEKDSFGIVVAGSGQGEAIAINKIRGIRAAVYHGGSAKIVEVSREHNNANVLCFGSRFVTEKEAKTAIDVFLKTSFEGGRHLRRLKKFEKLGGK